MAEVSLQDRWMLISNEKKFCLILIRNPYRDIDLSRSVRCTERNISACRKPPLGARNRIRSLSFISSPRCKHFLLRVSLEYSRNLSPLIATIMTKSPFLFHLPLKIYFFLPARLGIFHSDRTISSPLPLAAMLSWANSSWHLQKLNLLTKWRTLYYHFRCTE